MKRLIWNLRYTRIAHKFLRCTWKESWDMAVATDEDTAEICTPQEAFDEEMSYWAQDADLSLLDV